MTAILETILALIGKLAGGNATASIIQSVIAVLIQLVPVIVKEYQDLTPIVKNIIVALKADPATTAQQLAQLQAMEILWDADFEAAAAKALAEDAAADQAAAGT